VLILAQGLGEAVNEKKSNGITRLVILLGHSMIIQNEKLGHCLCSFSRGRTLGAPQSKAMKSIHANAHELRIKDKKGIYRVIYVLNIGDQVLIPHAFTKKTQKTPKKEIELSIKRLQELIDETK